MKVIFMGTPDFAVETLEAVIKAGHEVTLVVTQPDKPKGRGNAMQASSVRNVRLHTESRFTSRRRSVSRSVWTIWQALAQIFLW